MTEDGLGLEPAETVVFDLGGVLLDWHPRHLYGPLIDDPDELDHFLTEVCPLEWHFAHDAGAIMAETLPARAAQFPEHAELIGLWRDRYVDMVAGPIPDMVELVDELLAAGVPCYGLSNMPGDVWDDLTAAFPVIGRLRGVVVSGQEGVIKPDRRIFEVLIERYALDPATTVFVDDSPVNVTGARAAGLLAEHFVDEPTLRRHLRARGLPLGAPSARGVG